LSPPGKTVYWQGHRLSGIVLAEMTNTGVKGVLLESFTYGELQHMSGQARRFIVSGTALALALTVGVAPAARAATPAPPSKALPAALDVQTPYEAQVSCDPRPKPGVTAFAALMTEQYKAGTMGTFRTCLSDTSEHYDSRALDWMLSVNVPAQKAIADSVTTWLSANNGAVARRLGVSYLIWNHRMWREYAPERGWAAYTGAVPHTDHIHLSFSWDGAMKRTSWWTGKATSVADLGPCRVYAGQFAPLYTTVNTAPCPATLPAPPASPYAVAVFGQQSAQIATAQRLLGVPVTGQFGSATMTGLVSWQTRAGVPVTGVLDKATWARLAPANASYPRDFDGDRLADVLAVVSGTGDVRMYPGNGASRWKPMRVVGTGFEGFSKVFTAGAWTADALSDVMAQKPDGTLWLYPGTAAGPLGPPTQIGTGWDLYDQAFPVGDFNGDGLADLMARAPDGTLTLHSGNGSGGFLGSKVIGTGWGMFTSVFSPGDFTGDRKADVIARTSSGLLYLYPGNGSGGWLARRLIGQGWNGFSAIFSPGDLNGDGRSDLLARGGDGTLWMYAGSGTGGFLGHTAVGSGWNVFSTILP
jgi:peptidoglycan hydrolase-like protein with peptidoglycan-binding domain